MDQEHDEEAVQLRINCGRWWNSCMIVSEERRVKAVLRGDACRTALF